MGESYIYRGFLRDALYYLRHLEKLWAHKKHPKWGKRIIAKVYFIGEDQIKFNEDTASKWNFSGKVIGKSRFYENAITWLLDPLYVTKTVPAKLSYIPEKLLYIHGYHSRY